MFTEITNAVKGRQTINPRTVLGFYATVLGILLTAGVSSLAVLAGTHTRTDLIPFILAFCAIVLVLLLVGVFVITLIDPSKLMLSQVSGTEYAAIQQRVVLGDSLSGEHIELLPVEAPVVAIEGSPVQEIEASQPSHQLNEITGTTEDMTNG